MLPFKRIGCLLVAMLGLIGCGPRPVDQQFRVYREEVEAALDVSRASGPPPVDLVFPRRRDRRAPTSDSRIGPFDFLALLGCPLSEIIAERNGVLGRVREPTRQLAHEIAVISAIEECLPTLGIVRAQELEAVLGTKRAEFAAYLWNAVWLDDDLERFVAGGRPSVIGGEDSGDGLQQIRRAADAIEKRDVGALERAFSQLRDDRSVGPLFSRWSRSVSELTRVTGSLEFADVRVCDRRGRKLARIFSDRYLPYQTELARLSIAGREASEALAELYRVSSFGFEVPAPMRGFFDRLLGEEGRSGEETRVGLAARFQKEMRAHASAWEPLLKACGVLPDVAAS